MPRRHRPGNLQSGQHTNWGPLRGPSPFTGPRVSQTERAVRYLRHAEHLPECTANRVRLPVKSEFCDCGLESARRVIG